jgi:hypothetical protein
MPFEIQPHDVTCLCAVVDLPKRVIVEELPPRAARARFRVQAFVERDVGLLLEGIAPALRGARVRRWEGAFVFAEVEVPGERAGFVRQMVRALGRSEEDGLHVAAGLLEEEEPMAVRLERLVGALAG